MSVDYEKFSDLNSLITALRQKIHIIQIQNNSIIQLLSQNKALQHEIKNLKAKIQYNTQRANQDIMDRDKIIQSQISIINGLQKQFLTTNTQLVSQMKYSSQDDMLHELDELYNESQTVELPQTQNEIQLQRHSVYEPSTSFNDYSIFSNYTNTTMPTNHDNVTPISQNQFVTLDNYGQEQTITFEQNGLPRPKQISAESSEIQQMTQILDSIVKTKCHKQSQINQFSLLLSNNNQNIVQFLIRQLTANNISPYSYQFLIDVLNQNKILLKELFQDERQFQDIMELNFITNQANSQKTIFPILDSFIQLIKPILTEIQGQYILNNLVKTNQELPQLHNKGQIVEKMLKYHFYLSLLLETQEHEQKLSEIMQFNLNHLNSVLLKYINSNKQFVKLVSKYYTQNFEGLFGIHSIQNISLNLNQCFEIVTTCIQENILNNISTLYIKLIQKLTQNNKTLIKQNVNVKQSIYGLKNLLSAQITKDVFQNTLMIGLNYCMNEQNIPILIPAIVLMIKSQKQLEFLDLRVIQQLQQLISQNQAVLKPYNHILTYILIQQYVHTQQINIEYFKQISDTLVMPNYHLQQENVLEDFIDVLLFEQKKLTHQQFTTVMHGHNKVTVSKQFPTDNNIGKLNLPLLNIITNAINKLESHNAYQFDGQVFMTVILSNFSQKYTKILQALVLLNSQESNQVILGFIYASQLVEQNVTLFRLLQDLIIHILLNIKGKKHLIFELNSSIYALSVSQLCTQSPPDRLRSLLNELLQ